MEYTFIIEPGMYNTFENEAEQIAKCKEWGLLSEKASKTKEFFYKGYGMNLSCSIIGFADKITAVIEFDNKQRHCIHPSFLKEMQASNYGQKLSAAAKETADPEEVKEEAVKVARQEETEPIEETKIEEPKVEAAKVEEPKVETSPKNKTKKEKAQKVQLPEDKVEMTATVKEFTTVPNHFSDNDDEVVIYELVSITDPLTEIGTAWSSHSATLKKMELEIGDMISFVGKIVAKKLTKHPVPYKINNPAKIKKMDS
ncbi:hypothetical protein [Paenibacillus abyssi]|uniref:Uncharacterized protein n=1 Tax=Paenibacillus abyssi TaxID=1340531 RepID=A0A917LCZ2_9BACL|nr:hypothetical protein [Paenibacillus abyssi]GGG14626.1 hypothetical protein GCM10010916_34420 [Paenibacillus abyssi]